MWISKGRGEWEKAAHTVDPYQSNGDLISAVFFAVTAPVLSSDCCAILQFSVLVFPKFLLSSGRF